VCSHTHLCSFHVLATRQQCKLAPLMRLVRLRGCMPTLGLPRCATTPQQQPQTQPWLLARLGSRACQVLSLSFTFPSNTLFAPSIFLVLITILGNKPSPVSKPNRALLCTG
jgi:hypothetical protein